MFVFNVRDPNLGLRDVVSSLHVHGLVAESRNGPVVRFPRPVCIQYEDPRRRILDSPIRDANPFFHLFEAMWMLAGLRELRPLLLFNSGMAQYSDDGINLSGTAYGFKWRQRWGDQIVTALHKFRKNPDERRAVISMWDPATEHLGGEGKDFTCNLQVIFTTRPDDSDNPGGRILDMMVTNRSNDLVYGCMGSNLFHFSLFHEWFANHAGFSVGNYYQVSANLHLYTENPTSKRVWEDFELIEPSELGVDRAVKDLSLTLDRREIERIVLNHDAEITDQYLLRVVRPMIEAFKIYKIKTRTGVVTDVNKRVDLALEVIRDIPSPLGRAGCEWLERRRR